MPFEIFFFNDDFLSNLYELKYTSLIKIIIKEENVKWHLEAFGSELFMYTPFFFYIDHFVRRYANLLHL